MKFRQEPEPQRPASPDRRWWLPALFAAAAVTALAVRWPWAEVRFDRLFGQFTGPPGWQTTAGFTCLCSGMLVAVMALAETRTPDSRQAVRPGSVMLMGLAALFLAYEFLAGPGTLRGVTAIRTPWFWVVCTSVPLLLVVTTERLRALRGRRAG